MKAPLVEIVAVEASPVWTLSPKERAEEWLMVTPFTVTTPLHFIMAMLELPRAVHADKVTASPRDKNLRAELFLNCDPPFSTVRTSKNQKA